MGDPKKRSLAKTISWRVIATFITIIIAFLFLGEITASTALGITINPVKSIAYFLHERVWDRVEWGRTR
jgi:uncharacterized membrane protein